jgi:dTDP-4-amino-4,6-dideoxygalactose transaminase
MSHLPVGDTGAPAVRDELLKLHRCGFDEAEEAEVLATLRSGWLAKGPRTRRFEQEFAARVGALHGLGMNSCTAALHIALLTGGVGPGDEVIVPAITFAATANTVVHCGATPVFADVLPSTHCIDPASAARLVTVRTKAIVPVHFAGIPCAMDALHALAQEAGLFVLEDCAHGIETLYHGQPVGTANPRTRFAAYSFYATKNLITGEGGLLACHAADDHARASVLGLHGMSADAWKRYAGAEGADSGFKLYDIVEAGYKYNMFDLQAALGLVQLKKMDANWRLRQQRLAQYQALLADEERVEHIDFHTPEGEGACHLFAVRVAPALAAKRGDVILALRRRNVEAYVHFICLTGTQYYRRRFGTSLAQTPVAADLSGRSITLPLFPSMSEADVEYAVAMLKLALDEVAS